MNQIPSQDNQFIEGSENYTAQGDDSYFLQGNNNHVDNSVNKTVIYSSNNTDPQQGIKNSKSIIKQFKKSIKKKDREIWKWVYSRTYEGTGAEPRHFIVRNKNGEAQQIPLSQLFIPEGRGLVVPQAQFNRSDEVENLDLSSIRRIAEELDRMAYKILYVYNQNVEISLIYEEIGQIMDSIYKWMDEIENESTKQNIKSRFPSFIEMYSKYQEQLDDLRTKIKPKNSVTFC
jgi:hypothetical protein